MQGCDGLSSMLQVGPVVVAVSAGNRYWMMYSSGVLNDCGPNESVDHAVLVVGMKTDGEDNYWKVKNSWGQSWGEEGYIRISRDS